MLEIKFNGKLESVRSVKDVNMFPCLGKYKKEKVIVAFFNSTCGIVVSSDDPDNKPGEFYTNWSPESFIYINSGASVSFTVTNK